MIFFNRCFDKNRLKNLIYWSLMNRGEKKTVELVEKLKDLGFAYATQAGISLGIDDLKIPPEKFLLISKAEKEVLRSQHEYQRGNLTAVEKFQEMIDTWHKTSEILRSTVVHHFKSTDLLNPVYMMAFSGARGSISQVRQLVGMRGLMADPQGQIIEFPIRSNFREGLTLTEYIISCYGARKGLVDTALRTANSGYLTRRLVDVGQHILVSQLDCGTKKGIFLMDMKEGNKVILSLQTRLLGRILAEDIYLTKNNSKSPQIPTEIILKNTDISAFLAAKIVKTTKKILVRSPLMCEAKNSICQLCYGWSLAHGNMVSLGEAVGILAAQSIGEPGTQLTMRTFHTGGVFSGDIMDEIRAPFSGKVNFKEPLQGNLIRTPHGKIAFLTKIDGEFSITSFPNEASSQEGDLNSSSLNHTNLLFKKFKIPSSTVLFVRDGEKVFKKQLVAEISSLASRANQRIQSTHNLNSEFEGEIYFENVLLGVKIGKEGDIIQSARKLGSLWILSGKIYQSIVPLTFFPKSCDLVNKNTIINQSTIKIPYTGQLETYIKKNINFQNSKSCLAFRKNWANSFTALPKLNDFNHFDPSSSQALLLSEANHFSSFRTEKNQNLNNQFFFKQPLLSFPIRNFKFQKFGYFFSIKNTKFKDDKFFLYSSSSGSSATISLPSQKNQITKKQIATVAPLSAKLALKANLFPEQVNSKSLFQFSWFPKFYKTKTPGLLWIDQYYLNENMTFGQIFWVSEEQHKIRIDFDLFSEANEVQFNTFFFSFAKQKMQKYFLDQYGAKARSTASEATSKAKPFSELNSKILRSKRRKPSSSKMTSEANKNKTALGLIQGSSAKTRAKLIKLLGNNFKKFLFEFFKIFSRRWVKKNQTIFYKSNFQEKKISLFSNFDGFLNLKSVTSFDRKLIYPKNLNYRSEANKKKQNFYKNPLNFANKAINGKNQNFTHAYNLSYYYFLRQRLVLKKNISFQQSISFNSNKINKYFSDITFDLKPGWVYYPKNQKQALFFHKSFIPSGKLTIDNLVFDQCMIYLECIPIDTVRTSSSRKSKFFIKVKKLMRKLVSVSKQQFTSFNSSFYNEKYVFSTSSKQRQQVITIENFAGVFFLSKENSQIALKSNYIPLDCFNKSFSEANKKNIFVNSNDMSLNNPQQKKSVKIFLKKNSHGFYQFQLKKNTSSFPRVGNQSFDKKPLLFHSLLEESFGSTKVDFTNKAIWDKAPNINFLKKKNSNEANKVSSATTCFVEFTLNSVQKQKRLVASLTSQVGGLGLAKRNFNYLGKSQFPLKDTYHLKYQKFFVLIRKVIEFSIINNFELKNKLLKVNRKNLFLFSTQLVNFNKQNISKLFLSFPGVDIKIQSHFIFQQFKYSSRKTNLFDILVSFIIPVNFPFKASTINLVFSNRINSKFLTKNNNLFRNGFSLASSFAPKADLLKELVLLRKTQKEKSSFSFRYQQENQMFSLASLEFSLIRQIACAANNFSDVELQNKKTCLTSLLVYDKNWVSNKNALSITSFFSPYNGEVLSKKIDFLNKQSCLILTPLDQVSFFLQEQKSLHYVGNFIRFGDEVIKNLATPVSGQVIQIDKQNIIIRKAYPILFSSRGVFHAQHGDFVEKNTPLLTLFYQRLKTGDIVQGIPKIEEFFEARQTKEGEILAENLHTKLDEIFQQLKQKFSSQEAARKSVETIQQILVEGVQRVYQSQGVTISDKHIEIIVRQMTSKVKIIEGGQTGLLRGELIDLEWIELVNKGIETQKAEYSPIILGITKASLETESFISAASFQETTRILSRAAIERKTDFLRGLKENVILGHLIPAGTGFSLSFDPENFKSVRKNQLKSYFH